MTTSRDARGRWALGCSGNPGGRPREVQHVRELARQHTICAIETLVSVMADPAAPPSARVAAAEALLNRGWGRMGVGKDDGASGILTLRWATDAELHASDQAGAGNAC